MFRSKIPKTDGSVIFLSDNQELLNDKNGHLEIFRVKSKSMLSKYFWSNSDILVIEKGCTYPQPEKWLQAWVLRIGVQLGFISVASVECLLMTFISSCV